MIVVADVSSSSSGTPTLLVILVALIAASAALMGAVIAAVTAGRRQERQLSHDADRLRQELENERRIAALEDQRRVLDDGAELLLHLESLASEIDIEDTRNPPIPPDLDDLLSQAARVQARLSIRLGRIHPATQAFGSAIQQLDNAQRKILQANVVLKIAAEKGNKVDLDQLSGQIDSALQSSRERLAAFLDAANEVATFTESSSSAK